MAVIIDDTSCPPPLLKWPTKYEICKAVFGGPMDPIPDHWMVTFP